MQDELLGMRRQISRLRIMLFASMGVTGLLFLLLLMRNEHAVLRVGELQLVSSGNVVMRLGQSESGAGFLATYDNQGRHMVVLSKTNNGGSLTTYHQNGRESVDVSTTEAGGGFIGTYDSEGRDLVNLSKTGYGGDLRLFNRFGRVALKGSVIEGGGVLGALDESKKSMFYIRADKGEPVKAEGF